MSIANFIDQIPDIQKEIQKRTMDAAYDVGYSAVYTIAFYNQETKRIYYDELVKKLLNQTRTEFYAMYLYACEQLNKTAYKMKPLITTTELPNQKNPKGIMNYRNISAQLNQAIKKLEELSEKVSKWEE